MSRLFGYVVVDIIVMDFCYVLVAAVVAGGLGLTHGSVTSQAPDLLLFAVLCGFASFATVEAVKRLIGVRGAYQWRQVAVWLNVRGAEAGGVSELSKTAGESSGEGRPGGDRPVNAELERTGERDPFLELLSAMGIRPEYPRLYSGLRPGGQTRVFNLPVEQLAAQIGESLDTALLTPDGYPALMTSLAGNAVLPAKTERVGHGEALGSPTSSPRLSAEFPESELLARAQLVRSGVDQLQISVGEGWRRLVQGAAIGLSGLWGIVFAIASLPLLDRPRYVLAAIVIGGVSAWIIRDIVALLERG